jgi:hypothetical protein
MQSKYINGNEYSDSFGITLHVAPGEYVETGATVASYRAYELIDETLTRGIYTIENTSRRYIRKCEVII